MVLLVFCRERFAKERRSRACFSQSRSSQFLLRKGASAMSSSLSNLSNGCHWTPRMLSSLLREKTIAITLETEHDDDVGAGGFMNECKGENEDTLLLNSFDSCKGWPMNIEWQGFLVIIKSHLSAISSKLQIPLLLQLRTLSLPFSVVLCSL